MKEKLGAVFIGLLMAAVIAITGINAYALLMDSSRKQELTLTEAVGAIDYSHKLEGLIPLGTDHYWVGYDQTTQKVYYLRASEKWFEKNFPNGDAKDASGIKITGVKCKVTDHDLKNAMSDHMQEIGVPVLSRGTQNGEFLMLNASGVGIFSLMIAIGGVLCIILGFLMVIKKDSFSGTVKTIFGCFMIVWALALAYYLTRFGLLL
ncbi:MAG: hypothetical protein J6T47_06115, partial [Lachnospiraceae bacterium]|nr:hypothetical protein [Lachnospiraceae bacterium]